jgi:molybdopterin converting factor small subunit
MAAVMAAVHLPRTLLALFDGLEPVQPAEATTVAAALRALDGRHPGLLDRLCEPGPRLRPHIRVFVDRAPAELSTPIAGDSRIDVITAITGG